MRVVFLFPGQGIDFHKEGLAWTEASQAVRELVEMAAREAGADMDDLFRPSRGTLPTEVLEPVHTALCLGVHEELTRRGVKPDAVAGHSLGEIPACGAAGCCSAKEAIALAAERGRVMAREGARREGGMVRLSAATREEAEAAAAFAREAGLANLATHNTATQWGISGEWPALRRLAARYPVTPVPVAGAWHCDILAGGVEELREAARRALTGPVAVPMVANRTGEFVERTGDLPDLLAEQLTHPVEWVRSLSTLAASGATDFVTVGPGRLLRTLVHVNLGAGTATHATDTPDDLEQTVEALAP